MTRSAATYRSSHAGRRFYAWNGFSLIEVMAVLILMGLMAVGTVTVYRVRARGAGIDEVMGRLALIDTQARQSAARTGEDLILQYDLNTGTVVITDQSGEVERTLYVLPDGFRFERLASSGTQLSSGITRIKVTPQGISPSYAVRLSAVDDQSATQLFAGLTGQATCYDGKNGWHDVSVTLSSLNAD